MGEMGAEAEEEVGADMVEEVVVGDEEEVALLQVRHRSCSDLSVKQFRPNYSSTHMEILNLCISSHETRTNLGERFVQICSWFNILPLLDLSIITPKKNIITKTQHF